MVCYLNGDLNTRLYVQDSDGWFSDPNVVEFLIGALTVGNSIVEDLVNLTQITHQSWTILILA